MQLTGFTGAIDRHGECNINTASDFIAQYTTRQEYRYADVLPNYEQEWASFLRFGKYCLCKLIIWGIADLAMQSTRTNACVMVLIKISKMVMQF